MKNCARPGMTSRTFPNTRARPLVVAIALLFSAPAAMAQPTGGQVVSGQASIGSPANGLMTINQTSQKAILNWQSFSIGVGEATHFAQPVGGVALNRVTGGNASQILGTLSSTGQVFLINSSGILFGKGATLNVGGLVASTLNLGDADFIDGNYRFFNDGSARSVTNQGELSAYDGGYIALLAPEVRNEGTITARLGSVAIGAGNRVSLDLAGDGLINLNIEESALNGRIENRHAIHADGGQVILSARAAGSLAETVINNEGVIRANSVRERNGRIVLEGAHFISQAGSLEAGGANGLDGGAIQVAADNVLLAGDVDASGNQGGTVDVISSGNLIQTDASTVSAIGQDGVGGRVNLQASNAEATAQVFLSGELHADGRMGGQVRVLGDQVVLANAAVTATGTSLGGEILIGGGFQGAATGVAHSRKTSVNPSSTLDASATDYGTGGRVVVWSDDRTAFAGQALARGGVRGGDGGLIEVSGKGSVAYGGHVDAGATPGLGNSGAFLLDPKNIVISGAAQSSAGYFELTDPSPAANDRHGYSTLAFGVNQLMVLSPYDNNAASDAGAIYVYNTATGAMLSMLTGDQANDRVGLGGITTLYNSSGYDYLVLSPYWHGSAGAVTWFDGAGTGYSGAISASNSLVGASANDQIGSGGITTVYNSGIYDYFVRSPEWNGTFGALTFAHGNSAVVGTVSSANSLVGSQSGDRIGATLTQLSSGNYVVRSTTWNGGAGAVTFLDRTTGRTGVVDATNSLVGSSGTDGVGSGGVYDIYDSETYSYNYLVLSPNWSGTFGAVTFGSGSSGVSGVVSSANSYVGDTTGDMVGSSGIHSMYDYSGNYAYLIRSPLWHSSAGAVTWLDGAGSGFGGVVAASNSLVGGSANDQVGSGGFYFLDSGNYLVRSPNWGGGAGAVTFFETATGITGVVSASNSLVGSAGSDGVGSGGILDIYDNGTYNYLVLSPNWGGTFGAVTFGNGATGVSGLVGVANSFIGDTTGDRVGSSGITTLSNSGGYDYLIKSPFWHSSAGAVTWFDGSGTGFGGVVSASNSLVGGNANDQVGSGGITTVNNGGIYDYFVLSPEWNGTFGAVTFGAGASGISGAVSSNNSLLGSHSGDRIGATLTQLSSGNYVVRSTTWNGGAGSVTFLDSTTGLTGVVDNYNSLVGSSSTDAVGSGGIQNIYDNGTYNYLVLSPNWNGTFGAVTFGSGTSGVIGFVNSTNSFVGDTTGDRVGSSGITTLTNSGGYDYLIRSASWHSSAGAVTWFDGGGTGFGGVVSASNSLVGSHAGDQIGATLTQLSSGNYVVRSTTWNGGAGSVTFLNSTTGVVGVVDASNSLVGSSSTDGVGSGGVQSIYDNGTYNYLVLSPNWNGTFGAVTFGSGTSGVSGFVSSANSFVGDTTGDRVGSSGITTLYNSGGYDYLIRSASWHSSAGAVTWFDGSGAGFGGVVGASNSLVGSHAGDQIGATLTQLSSGNYVVRSTTWNGGAGSVTFLDITTGRTGVVDSTNSLVGSTSTDGVGSGGIQNIYDNGTYNYLVLSPNWNGTFGAVTFGNGATGVSGVVSAANSFVGDTTGDRVGSSGITTLSNSGGYDYLIRSTSWHSSAGAVTWFDGSGAGFGGVVSASNSLVGGNANDQVGSGGITTVYNSGIYDYFVRSPQWNGSFGAVTFGRGNSGVVGTVSSSNSLVGSHVGDSIGSTLTQLSSGNYVVRSTTWNGGAGAVTFMDRTTGRTGVVDSTNSLVGSSSTDGVGSGGVQNIYDNGTYNYLVLSPNWNGNFGAVTFGNGATGVSGVVSSANSYVGDTAGDRVGSGGITTLSNSGGYAYLIKSPLWHGSAGAVTWFDGGGAGFGGAVSASNSLVGGTANDQVGSGGIYTFYVSGVYNYLVFSPNWNGTYGAVTFGNGATGVTGTVSSSNSVVGSHVGDQVGSGYYTSLGSGNYLINSPNWNGGAGALTYMTMSSGKTGTVSAANSIVGAQAGDFSNWDYDSLGGGLYLFNIASWGGNAGRLLIMSSGGFGWGFGDDPANTITISPTQIADIANSGTEVLLQANNDITLDDDIVIDNPNGQGGELIMRAGRSIFLNGDITSDGDVSLYANDTAANGVLSAYRDSGLAEITMASGRVINADGTVLAYMLGGLGAGTEGGITLETVLASVIDFQGTLQRGFTVTQGIFRGTGTINGNLSIDNATFAPGHSPGSVVITGDLILGSNSVLSIEYGGTSSGQYDLISVGGTAFFNGALELLSYGGFAPSAMLTESFVTGRVSGSFSSVTGGLAGLVAVPVATNDGLDNLASELLPEDLDEDAGGLAGALLPAGIEQMFEDILAQAELTNLVGTTQQMQTAAVQLVARREARMQSFAQAISQLRSDPRVSEIAECNGGKGEGSGACLATRKVRDLDKLIADAPADTHKRIALLIGNDAYSGDIPALTTPVSDVEAVASRLKEKHGFDVIVLRNAKKADLIREMNRLASSTVVADSVMVMYAGHGYQEEGSKSMGYWIPVDAKADSAAGWISNQDISKLLFSIPARQVMLISDSCFSGSLTREQRVKAVKNLKREDVLKQRSVLVLSSGGEEPVTDEGHDGHSIFAWNLLKVLDSADRGMTGFELYRQVHEGVIKEFPQQPQYGASIFAGHKGEGDYYVTD